LAAPAEEKAWVLGWADWLKDNYNFSPSQIAVGLDNTDAHAYDIKELSRHHLSSKILIILYMFYNCI